MRSLVIEDDFVARCLLVQHLRPYGTCDEATTGEEGIAAVVGAIEKDHPYDLIVIDIMLPQLSGGAVLKKIREIEKANQTDDDAPRSKIIMATSLDARTSRTAAFRWECDAYLTKPIDLSTLTLELHKLGLIDDESDPSWSM